MTNPRATLQEAAQPVRWRCVFSRLRRWQPVKTASATRQSASLIFCERGSAIVEMALSSMILLAMILGTIEMCLALYTYNFISEAAREGARYAMVRGSSCTVLTDCGITSAQIQTYLQGLALGGSNASKYMTVTTTWLSASSTLPTTWTSCGTTQCNDPGNAVRVKVSYAFPLNIPFLPNSTLKMSSTSQMVIAN